MLLYMRTMIVLDDKLHREARAYAASRGTTLKALVEEALRLRLARKAKPGPKRNLRLPTFRGDGLQPGVSLDHMETVYDRMDPAQ